MAQDTTQLTKDFATLRMSSMFDALTAQRNNALNEVANLVAENAVLKAALERQAAKVTELESLLDKQTSFE